MTIRLNDFRLEETPSYFEASCAIVADGFPPRLIFRVPKSNADSVDNDEPNWAAMALYWQAMMMGRDLIVEADLSPLLLHNMRGDLMALMRNYEPKLKNVRIDAGTSTPTIPIGPRDVMTGFSGGVDSFATYLLYTHDDVPASLRLTALGVYQVGALGPTSLGDTLLGPAVDHARQHAENNGLGLYSLMANMDEVFAPAKPYGPVDFRRTVGLRNASAAYLLQNGVSTYLPSGSVGYDSATYGPYTCTENMDPVFQPLLSTEKLRVQPAGAGLTRTQKLALLVDDPQAQSVLNVCLTQSDHRADHEKINCSTCWKCTQTLMALDGMGKLDNFRQVFDVDVYLSQREKLLRRLISYAQRQDAPGILFQIEEARAAGVPMPRAKGEIEMKLRQIAKETLNRLVSVRQY